MPRTLVWIFALVLLVYVVSFFVQRPHTNVIVISVDSLRADHMGLYGYERDTTPNIDAWASGATVFTNYFATSYLTPISEGSVQTGVQPFTSGIINFGSLGRASVPLLAEILKAKGYQTAAFGSSPEYEVNEGLKATFGRGFDSYTPLVLPAGGAKDNRAVLRTAPFAVEQSIDWLRGHGDKPFYLWLPLGGAHTPYFDDAPKHFTDPEYHGFLNTIRSDEFNTLYGYLYQDKQYKKNVGFPAPVIGSVTRQDAQYIVDRYDDGVHATDAMLGELFAYLRRSGLERNTVVVFESEHGETLGERGYVWHYDIYNETTHVPLIIKVPHVRGGVDAVLASSVDVIPTVLNLLTIPTPRTDGISLLSKSGPVADRASILITRTPLWEIATDDATFAKADAQNHFYDTAVRTTEWKLIHRKARTAEYQYGWWGKLTGTPIMRPEYELYDVVADSKELHDVYTERQNDPTVVALKRSLADYEHGIAEQKQATTTLPVQPYF